MEDVYEQLMTAVITDDVDEVKRLIATNIDFNYRCDQGASLLYGAILYANPIVIRSLLENGADPNLVAEEPAATIYAETPLDLAHGARFLLDWDKFHPIARLLEEFGARNSDDGIQSNKSLTIIESDAREWQARKAD